jgi:AraC family transcriptional activator of mtrCDE
VTISENASAGERLDMLCGRFILAPEHNRLLHAYFPRRLVVHTADRDASTARRNAREQLVNLIAIMRSESSSDSLGGRAILNAVSAALFALIMRLASESHEAATGLLALASHPRLAAALSALFNEPARPWTLPELALLCNMSRATLARHFQQRLGRSPSDLLTDIRMTLAANQLRKFSALTAAVAETAGYQSEAAFQRVVKQRMGMTPAQWRRATTSSDTSRR